MDPSRCESSERLGPSRLQTAGPERVMDKQGGYCLVSSLESQGMGGLAMSRSLGDLRQLATQKASF